MRFKEFTQNVVQWMYEHTGEEYIIHQKVKNNGQYVTSITKKNPESNKLIPDMNLLPAYQEVKDGRMTFEQVAAEIEKALTSDLEEKQLRLPDMDCFENNKPYIFGSLINADRNREYLKDTPYRVIAGNLALCYRFLSDIEPQKDGISSILITNNMMDTWDIAENDLYALAMENTPKLFPLRMENIFEAITHMSPEEASNITPDDYEMPPMYICSTQICANGATSILYPEMQIELKKRLGDSYYLIPSSTDEFIAVPSAFSSIAEARDMVQFINKTDVPPEMYLSDDIYQFSDGELINKTAEMQRDDLDYPDSEL